MSLRNRCRIGSSKLSFSISSLTVCLALGHEELPLTERWEFSLHGQLINLASVETANKGASISTKYDGLPCGHSIGNWNENLKLPSTTATELVSDSNTFWSLPTWARFELKTYISDGLYILFPVPLAIFITAQEV